MNKYDYRVAKFNHPVMRGYWVKLYFITDVKHTYTFFNQEEWFDNFLMMSEVSHVQMFTHEILVTQKDFADIFKEIEDMQNVSETNIN